jgi:hypothetical protein
LDGSDEQAGKEHNEYIKLTAGTYMHKATVV